MPIIKLPAAPFPVLLLKSNVGGPHNSNNGSPHADFILPNILSVSMLNALPKASVNPPSMVVLISDTDSTTLVI